MTGGSQLVWLLEKGIWSRSRKMGDVTGNGGETQIGEDSPFPLTDTDIWVLSQTDEEFKLHGWDELKDIIG